MKGGVILTDTWKTNPEGALFYFIENCRQVKILTDNSVSCVTYVFNNLPDNITSPYVIVRSNNLNKQVRQILLKVGFISSNSDPNKDEYNYCKRGLPLYNDHYNGQMQAVTSQSLIKEVKIQQDLFEKSFTSTTSPFEPICPAIICYSNSISPANKNIIFNNIDNKLKQRNGYAPNGYYSKYDTSDNQITYNLYNVPNKMSLIVMEFMDGFVPLGDLLGTTPKETIFKQMHNYELNRMAELGYIHSDSHYGNVMINPTYPYFTTVSNDDYYGRALIIDFGRVKQISGTNYNLRNYYDIKKNKQP